MEHGVLTISVDSDWISRFCSFISFGVHATEILLLGSNKTYGLLCSNV